MANKLAKDLNELWWAGILESIFAIIFGIVAVFWPGLTLVTLVYLFSAFILVIGLIEIVHGFASFKRRDTWWMTLTIGIIALGVGLYLVRHPQVSFATFILIVGLTLIFRGVMFVIQAFIDRPTSYKILDYIGGLAAVVAGIIVLFQPVSGGLAFVWALGLYAFIYGCSRLAISIYERNELDLITDSLKRE